MLVRVLLTLLMVSLTMAKSDMCTGCFKPITTDWKTDAILKLVVDEALRGSISYLTETFGINAGNADTFAFKDVSDLESQVVAGTNYRMTLKIRRQCFKRNLVLKEFKIV